MRPAQPTTPMRILAFCPPSDDDACFMPYAPLMSPKKSFTLEKKPSVCGLSFPRPTGKLLQQFLLALVRLTGVSTVA